MTFESSRDLAIYESGVNQKLFVNDFSGGSTSSSTGSTSSGSSTSGISIGAISGILDTVLGFFGSLSCWGVTWTPAEGEQFVQNALPTLQADLNATLGASDIVSAVNNVINNFRASYARDEAWLKKCNNPASGCTADTLEVMTDALYQGLNLILTNFVNSNPELNLKIVPSEYTYVRPDGSTECGFTFPSYQVALKPSSPIDIITSPFSGNTLKLAGVSWVWALVILGVLFGSFTKKGKREVRKLKKQLK